MLGELLDRWARKRLGIGESVLEQIQELVNANAVLRAAYKDAVDELESMRQCEDCRRLDS